MGRLVAQVTNEDSARLSRVLDAKNRVIGVDVGSLEQQVGERKAAEDAERQRDIAYAQLSRYYDDTVKAADQEAAASRRKAAVEEQECRNETQLRDTRREWDLNRPDAKLLDTPARISDDDERCGVSSLQKFHGEDLSAAERRNAQQQQSHRWWLQQTADTRARKEQEDSVQRAHGDLVRLYDTVQQTVMAEEGSAKRASQSAVMSDNARLAALHSEQAKTQQALENNLRSHEIKCALHNPLLVEDPRQAASALSAGRVRVDHWKGMSNAEHRAIIDQQFRQQQELKARRQDEVRKEAQWAQTHLMTDKAIKEQQRNVDNFCRQQEQERLAFLKRQAEEKRARDAALNDVYANAVSSCYFEQFGTSHR
eukprot:jgi/Ulvmu1/4596/UM002_0325.1